MILLFSLTESVLNMHAYTRKWCIGSTSFSIKNYSWIPRYLTLTRVFNLRTSPFVLLLIYYNTWFRYTKQSVNCRLILAIKTNITRPITAFIINSPVRKAILRRESTITASLDCCGKFLWLCERETASKGIKCSYRWWLRHKIAMKCP